MASSFSNWFKRHINIIIYLTVVAVLAVDTILITVDGKRFSDDWSEEVVEEEVSAPKFRKFDPNTATFRELLEAGLPRNIAVGIIRWRESGKVYRIKEDLALCYGMSDSLYFDIEPYIVIGEEFKYRPKTYERGREDKKGGKPERSAPSVTLEPFSLDTVGMRYLTLLGFSTKEAELIIRYREIIGGYRSFEKFDECYAVDSTMAERLRPYIIFTTETVDTLNIEQENRPIEINSADSATLCRVRGIGPKSAREIIIYRKLLGGYYSVEQISELSVVLDKNFEQILPQIYCDSAEIKKININFAASSELETHPYITSRMLRKIINKRVLKGGWSTIQEMIDDDIFTSEEAMRIAPYLDFGTDSE
jgi:DNA uptake protein ComE-like DNA-binding protein